MIPTTQSQQSPRQLRLLFDANIHGVEQLFAPHAELVAFDNTAELARLSTQADALLVSSQTPLDDKTKLGSIQFVGSPTAGVSHISDAIRTHFATQPDCYFASAPGANATAVADYILAAISEMHYPITQSTCVGIVGFGHVGKCVAHRLKGLVGTVLAFDPLIPTWQQQRKYQHVQPVDLQALLARADIITLHCNLHDGKFHPSRHLLTSKLLAHTQNHATLINTARGEIIEPKALSAYLTSGKNAVLDTWHNEPNVTLDHVVESTLATPHIAGHSLAAKEEALHAVYQQFCRFFALTERPLDAQSEQADKRNTHSSYRMVYNADELLSQAARVVAIKTTSQQFKTKLQMCKSAQPTLLAKEFLSLRTSYPLRTQIHYD